MFLESCVKNQIIHDCINLYAYIYIEFFPPLQITQTCSGNPCKNNATCQPGTGGQVCQSKACVTLKDWEVFQMHSSKNSGMSVPYYWHCVDMITYTFITWLWGRYEDSFPQGNMIFLGGINLHISWMFMQ